MEEEGPHHFTPLLNNGPGKPSRSKTHRTHKTNYSSKIIHINNQIKEITNGITTAGAHKIHIKHDNKENNIAPKWEYNQEVILGMKEIAKREIITHVIEHN